MIEKYNKNYRFFPDWKAKNADISKNWQFPGFFSHKLDDKKLLYKCAKFQVNSLCGFDFN